MIHNKTILIAGASSGMGRQVALLLSHHNNRIIITARSKAELEHLSHEITDNGSQALVVVCDALLPKEAENCIQQSINQFSSIDIALLNIGDGPAFNMSNTTVAAIQQNTQPLIAHMKQQGFGLIAHTNSLAGFLGLPMQGPYSAAKAAGRVLMDICRIELKPFGLKFVSVYPGFVATDRVQQDGIPSPFEISEAAAAKHIIYAIEKEKSDYAFPFMTASLVKLARVLPKALTARILVKLIPQDY